MAPLTNAHEWHKTQQNNKRIWAHQSVANLVSDQWFLPEFWRDNNAVIGESKGRYTTYFIKQALETDELKMVLRHYYRGGLISKLSKDRFIFTSFAKTRAFAELAMLNQMRELGLPVPRPIAAMVTKVGLFKCSNDILIELISDAQDGFQLLSQNAFSDAQWQAIGQTIKQFHDHGVYHSDLNIHNIMFQANEASECTENADANIRKVWLIDFDRCCFKTPARDWQQANLDRLKRSLEKEKSLNSSFNFSESDWQQLTAGYAVSQPAL